MFKGVKDGTSLRYDLTVPLVRYFCNNGLESMRRFQVGKVFRKDNSEVEKGRFREFYQADLDIVGNYEHLASEIEIFWLINSVLEELGIEKYTIKYNYRNNLYDMCKKIKKLTKSRKKLLILQKEVIKYSIKYFSNFNSKKFHTLFCKIK